MQATEKEEKQQLKMTTQKSKQADEISKKQLTTPEHQTGAEYAELHQYSAHKQHYLPSFKTDPLQTHKCLQQLINALSYMMTANNIVTRSPVKGSIAQKANHTGLV